MGRAKNLIELTPEIQAALDVYTAALAVSTDPEVANQTGDHKRARGRYIKDPALKAAHAELLRVVRAERDNPSGPIVITE